MPRADLTQVLVFRTGLSLNGFLETWRPFADRFLSLGVQTITLSRVSDDPDAAAPPDGDDDHPGPAGLRYVSRNVWPADAYRRAFPSGLAADGGSATVTAIQAGVFVREAQDTGTAAASPADQDLSMALLPPDGLGDPDSAVRALLRALPADPALLTTVCRGTHPGHRFAVLVTVHGPPGTGTATATALRSAIRSTASAGSGVILTGRDVLQLTR